MITKSDGTFKPLLKEGKCVKFTIDKEKRSVSLFCGEDDDYMIIFRKPGGKTPLRLTRECFGALLVLMYEEACEREEKKRKNDNKS